MNKIKNFLSELLLNPIVGIAIAFGLTMLLGNLIISILNK